MGRGMEAYLWSGEVTHGRDEVRIDNDAVEREEDILG